MATPGTIYAYDEHGRDLRWNAISPPPGWKWCPRLIAEGGKLRPHYKPNDGEACPYCGSPDKRED